MRLSQSDLAACNECRRTEDEDGAVVAEIIQEVAAVSGVPAAAILSRWRGRYRTSRARQIVMFIADREGVSRSAIGRALGRDHSTVIKGIAAEAERREKEKASHE